jgi:hypothetical protein
MSGENSAIAQSIFLVSVMLGYIQKQMANSHRTPMMIVDVITNSLISLNASSISILFWWETFLVKLSAITGAPSLP